MKIFLKSLLLLSLFSLTLGKEALTLHAQSSSVPTEYYPNYKIQADRDKIQEHFVQIEAAQKI
ncbi:MAG: hypothetical protein LBP53_02355 [Candidatus Peribacteria bacterium]|jgi:PP-loop superfamily ATP-utilizing enzyme|nr:hypothetical protein [Candidatus Peribacteria bacterium]